MREPVGLNRLKTSWEKGPEAHLNLWRRLRAGGRQVRVVAVAWEPSLLTRAGKVLAAWVGKDSQDEDSPDTLCKAIVEGDWETIEQHGGLNEVMSKIGKRAEGGRIDGFTLWRSERCRQIGAHSTKGAWCAEVVRALSHSPVRQVTRRTGHHGGSAPPPVRLRRLRGGRAGAPAGAPQLSLPAGVAPVQIIPAGRRASRLSSRRWGQRSTRRRRSRPQLIHWPRPERLDRAHNQRSPTRSARGLAPHSAPSDSWTRG